MSKVDPMIWFQNFKTGVGILLDEERAKGYLISSILMSKTLHERASEAAGYHITDMYGYIVEIVDTGNDGDEILICGHPYN